MRRCRGRARNRETHAENGVGAEFALVDGSVRGTQRAVDGALVQGIRVMDGRGKRAVDVVDREPDAFSGIAPLILVAQFDRFVNAG